MRILFAAALPVLFFSLAVGAPVISAAPLMLTGRFVAHIDGPPLTDFGENRELYVFETSSNPPQLAILNYRFLIYEPLVPRSVLDYSLVYTFVALADESCNNSIEDISKAYIFNSSGTFLGTKYAITYSKNLPLSFNAPIHETLPCYSLSADSMESLWSRW